MKKVKKARKSRLSRAGKRLKRIFSWQAWVESASGRGSQIGIPDKRKERF